MSSGSEKSDLESLVAAALQLSVQHRQRFLEWFPPETRVAIIRRLDRLNEDCDRTLIDHVSDEEIQAAATVFIPPDALNESSVGSHGAKTVVNDGSDGARRTTVAGDKTSVAAQATGDRDRDNNRGPGDDSVQGAGVYLVKLHARGAIGEVFVAYDEKLAREVAIKRIRPELSPNPRRAKRFLREAVITAKLQHPGIVPIYSLGDAGGSPHYTMPLVSGVTMADLIRDTHRALGGVTSPQKWMSAMRPLLRHFIAICNAIDYAHTENVVHRDLKPSNIMIGSRGQTLVLDWGCAKNLNETESVEENLYEPQSDSQSEPSTGDDTEDRLSCATSSSTAGVDITVSGSVMGTVEYMSPEQAAGENELVGKPSDIFGLGATLFSLLTNRRTIDHDRAGEVGVALTQVKRGEFRRIEEVDARVPASIAAVCHRAMAFGQEARYPTAGELGRDVEAFLSGDSVDAYEEPWHERMMRLGRRHQTLVTTLAGILLLGFVLLVGVNVVVNRQKAELASLNSQLTASVSAERDLRGRANRNEDLVVKQLYGNQMLLASEASTEAGGLGRMRELVSNWADGEYDFLRGWEWRHLSNLGSRELSTYQMQLTANQILTTRDEKFAKVFDQGLSTILTMDLERQKVLAQQKIDPACLVVDFTSNQSQVAMGHRDGRVTVSTSAVGGEELQQVSQHREHTARVLDVEWNIGGDLLASCDASGKVVIWHVGDQKVVARAEGVLRQSNKSVLMWGHDGHQLFWTTGRQLNRLDVATKKRKTILKDSWIVSPCMSHEGKLLAYVGPGDSIVVADIDGKVQHRFTGHQLFVETLKWHPQKHFLLSSSADGTVRIWNADTEKEVRQLLGHEGPVYAAAWNRSGTHVISGGFPEDALRVWDVSDVGKEAFDRELQDYPAFAWHPSGERLVVAEGIDLVIQNSAGDARWIRAEDPAAPVIYAVDYHPAEDIIACVAGNGRVWTVDAQTGQQQTLYDPGVDHVLFPAITSRGVQWSPDGKFLAAVTGKGTLKVWRVSDGEPVSGKIKCRRMLSIAWAPATAQGKQRVAAVGTGGGIIIFDPQTQETIQRIVQHGWKTGLAWSPDGKVLAVSDRRNVNLWNAEDGTLIEACDGPSAMVWDVAWSSSENRFAALTEDGKVCIWDSQTWGYLAKFALHGRSPYCLRWSPDGKRLASTARHGRLVFQDAD